MAEVSAGASSEDMTQDPSAIAHPGCVRTINVDENESLRLFLEYMAEMKATESIHPTPPAEGSTADDAGDNNIVVLLDESGNELDEPEMDSDDDLDSSSAETGSPHKPLFSPSKPYQRKPKVRKEKSSASSEPGRRRGAYRTYSLAFKLAVVEYAFVHGRMPASKKFGIKYELIRMWCTQREQLIEATSSPMGRKQTKIRTPLGRPKKRTPKVIRSAKELKDSPRTKDTHKNYSMAFKLEVIEHYEKSKNQSATARKFNIDRRQIKQWVELKDKIQKRCEENKDHIRLENNCGLPLMSPTLEIRLVSWAQEIAMLGSEFSIPILCDKALEYYHADDNVRREAEGHGYKNFSASYSWALRFLDRNNINVSKNSIREEDIPEELQMYDRLKK